MNKLTAHNANAFASTFYFYLSKMQPHEKTKRACKPSHGDSARVRCKIDTTHLRTDRRATDNMGLNEMAGEVVNQTFVLLINSCGRLTVRASKPPLR